MALCLQTLCLQIDNNDDIIYLFHHVWLCFYRLGHTCTPLLINYLLLLLLLSCTACCVYGLAHTCSPLLIYLILLCAALYLWTCTKRHRRSEVLMPLRHPPKVMVGVASKCQES